jgi:SWI/SNF-related matrix-associated actin-dependent regulator of chromatin subfamily A3
VSRDQFKFWISSPVLSNQQHSLHTLRKLVHATCLRRTKALPQLSSTLNLPLKTERVQVVELAPDERKLYEFFKRRSYLLANTKVTTESEASSKSNTKPLRRQIFATTNTISEAKHRRSAANVIVLISVLRMICEHGEALLPQVAREAWRNRDGGAVSWELLETVAEAKWSCCECGQGISRDEDGKQQADVLGFSCRKHVACDACMTRREDTAPTCPKCSIGQEVSSESASPRSNSPAYSPSSKVSALLCNLLCTFQRKNSSSSASLPVKRYVTERC